MLEQEPIQKEQEQKPKPIRLLIEHDDGKIRYLEGNDLEKWLEDVNYVLGFMQATRRQLLPQNFMQVKWKEIHRKDIDKIFKTSNLPS